MKMAMRVFAPPCVHHARDLKSIFIDVLNLWAKRYVGAVANMVEREIGE